MTELILWGAAWLGIETLRKLRSIGIEPLCFIDRNPDLWGTQVEGLVVLEPAVALAFYPDARIIITITTNGSQVIPLLEAVGHTNYARFSQLYFEYPEVFLPFFCMATPTQTKEEMLSHIDLWADEESRKEYAAQIEWRFTHGEVPPKRPIDECYFPDFLPLTEHENFVDGGAYDGDTIRLFLDKVQRYGSITAIEPDPNNFAKLDGRYRALNCALGAELAAAHFRMNGDMSSALDDDGESYVTIIPLDRILASNFSYYIKMDIEGAELDALRGGINLLKAGESVWAITLYHKPEDLWAIPEYIHSINPNYKLFLRRYGDECWETICYAVPPERLVHD